MSTEWGWPEPGDIVGDDFHGQHMVIQAANGFVLMASVGAAATSTVSRLTVMTDEKYREWWAKVEALKMERIDQRLGLKPAS